MVCGLTVDHVSPTVSTQMSKRNLEDLADLGLGTSTGIVLTYDHTHAYVDENMGTS